MSMSGGGGGGGHGITIPIAFPGAPEGAAELDAVASSSERAGAAAEVASGSYRIMSEGLGAAAGASQVLTSEMGRMGGSVLRTTDEINAQNAALLNINRTIETNTSLLTASTPAQASYLSQMEARILAERRMADAAAAGMGRVERKLAGLEAMGSPGLYKAAGVAAVGIGVAAYEGIKKYTELNKLLVQSVTHAGVAKDKLPALMSGVISIGKETGQSFNDIANGLYRIASATASLNHHRGASTKQLLELSRESSIFNIMAGVPAGAQSEQSARLFGIMRNIGLKGATTDKQIAPLLTAASGAADMRASELVGALGRGPLVTAKLNHLSANEVLSWIGLMTNMGMTGSTAGTAVKTAITTFLHPTQIGAQAGAMFDITQTGMAEAKSMGYKGKSGMQAVIQYMTDRIGTYAPPSAPAFKYKGKADQEAFAQKLISFMGPGTDPAILNDYMSGALQTRAHSKLTGQQAHDDPIKKAKADIDAITNAILKQLWGGTKTMGPVATLLLNSKKYSNMMGYTAEHSSQKDYQAKAKLAMAQPGVQFARMKETINASFIEIGKELLPIALTIGHILTGIVGAFAKFKWALQGLLIGASILIGTAMLSKMAAFVRGPLRGMVGAYGSLAERAVNKFTPYQVTQSSKATMAYKRKSDQLLVEAAMDQVRAGQMQLEAAEINATRGTGMGPGGGGGPRGGPSGGPVGTGTRMRETTMVPMGHGTVVPINARGEVTQPGRMGVVSREAYMGRTREAVMMGGTRTYAQGTKSASGALGYGWKTREGVANALLHTGRLSPEQLQRMGPAGLHAHLRAQGFSEKVAKATVAEHVNAGAVVGTAVKTNLGSVIPKGAVATEVRTLGGAALSAGKVGLGLAGRMAGGLLSAATGPIGMMAMMLAPMAAPLIGKGIGAAISGLSSLFGGGGGGGEGDKLGNGQTVSAPNLANTGAIGQINDKRKNNQKEIDKINARIANHTSKNPSKDFARLAQLEKDQRRLDKSAKQWADPARNINKRRHDVKVGNKTLSSMQAIFKQRNKDSSGKGAWVRTSLADDGFYAKSANEFMQHAASDAAKMLSKKSLSKKVYGQDGYVLSMKEKRNQAMSDLKAKYGMSITAGQAAMMGSGNAKDIIGYLRKQRTLNTQAILSSPFAKSTDVDWNARFKAQTTARNMLRGARGAYGLKPGENWEAIAKTEGSAVRLRAMGADFRHAKSKQTDLKNMAFQAAFTGHSDLAKVYTKAADEAGKTAHHIKDGFTQLAHQIAEQSGKHTKRQSVVKIEDDSVDKLVKKLGDSNKQLSSAIQAGIIQGVKDALARS